MAVIRFTQTTGAQCDSSYHISLKSYTQDDGKCFSFDTFLIPVFSRRIMTHPDPPHPATVPQSPFHLQAKVSNINLLSWQLQQLHKQHEAFAQKKLGQQKSQKHIRSHNTCIKDIRNASSVQLQRRLEKIRNLHAKSSCSH